MPASRFRWPTLFQDSARPLFVLNRGRRLRFVNAAWESLTGEKAADVHGKACLRKGPTEPLYRTLAPPSELNAKSMAVVRRPAPPQENGPPWWDITFLKLTTGDGVTGYLGVIDVVAPSPGQPAKSISPFIGSLRKKHAEAYRFDLFDGASLDAQRFLARLHHAAASTVPVWLHGETGSGKATAARVIHHNGPRAEQPFVRIDCAALQPYLIEGLLFGSGGLANNDRIGTLFLRNPSALPRDLQQKLSDWLLQTPKAPRSICASLKTASEEVAAGTLRSEFATALAILELAPLPLRERLDDLPRIVERIAEVNEDVYPVLRAHRWPGNLRELHDALRTARTAATLPRYLREKTLVAEAPSKPRPSLDAILEAVEKKLLQRVLVECDGNQTEAASRLGIVRARYARRLEALGLAKGAE